MVRLADGVEEVESSISKLFTDRVRQLPEIGHAEAAGFSADYDSFSELVSDLESWPGEVTGRPYFPYDSADELADQLKENEWYEDPTMIPV